MKNSITIAISFLGAFALCFFVLLPSARANSCYVSFLEQCSDDNFCLTDVGVNLCEEQFSYEIIHEDVIKCEPGAIGGTDCSQQFNTDGTPRTQICSNVWKCKIEQDAFGDDICVRGAGVSVNRINMFISTDCCGGA